MARKRSLETSTSSPSAAITPIVKRSYRANFDRLCALHNWTPSGTIRDKLALLLQLSGPRLQASELLPLAFTQHYPFIWTKDFLLLGYNDANKSVWYKAHPTGRGIARGRYYDSSQVNILGKNTVTRFYQSWVDVFDIEHRGLDRSHEYFTGVYLILKKFPNLRWKCELGDGDPRDPQNATRVTGVAEYPFNDDHVFMQESPADTNDAENEDQENGVEADTDTDYEDQDDISVVKKERSGSHDDENPLSDQPSGQHNSHVESYEPIPTSSSHSSEHIADKQAVWNENSEDSMSFPRKPIFRASSPKPASPSSPPLAGPFTRDPEDSHFVDKTPTSTSYKRPPKPRLHSPPHTSNPTKSPYFTRKTEQRILELSRRDSQDYREFTIRVPADEPRRSNMDFRFAAVRSIGTAPNVPVPELSGGGAKGA
ncbi:hypothetical protein E4T50_12896 [Aureobasidium sp. EXF-12298]|nr:hypothetical protein E4T50_12896 [Aureobasidium sp. EXF-12298]